MTSVDFMLTTAEVRLKRQKRRRILLFGLSLAFVIIAGYFGGRPAINEIKSWQARRHADQAFAYIQQQKWVEARNEATAAYQLRPVEPQALRAVARFLSRTKQVEALDFWKQLQDRQTLTREDLRDEAAIALVADEVPRAEDAVGRLISSNPQPADWLLAAQLAINKGVPEDAIPFAEKAFLDPNATEPERFQATLLELTSPQTATRAAEAWSRLQTLSRGQSETALNALVVLAQRTLSQSSSNDSQAISATDLSHALEKHPLAKASQKLIALELLEHVNPSLRKDLIERAISNWKGGETDSLVALGTWLNGKGEYQREIDTISLDRALQSRELFLQRLDALGALGRWQEVKQLLESDRFPLEPVVQKMYLARCNAQLGEKTAAENNWQRALEAAAGDPFKMMLVGQYAEKNGLIRVAGSAYEAARSGAPKLRVAQQGRLRIAQATGDTAKIHGVLADMLRLWPNDHAVQNDEAYTRLLLSKEESANELNSIEQLAEKLMQRDPASLPHRTLLALARLRQNRPADALAVYSNIQVTQRALTPSALAVHAAVLAANGRLSEAQAEWKEIPMDKLLPEERELVPAVSPLNDGKE